jgi:hypothetical protein
MARLTKAEKENDKRSAQNKAKRIAAERKDAVKKEEKAPSHYQQASGRGAHVRRSERHHGED